MDLWRIVLYKVRYEIMGSGLTEEVNVAVSMLVLQKVKLGCYGQWAYNTGNLDVWEYKVM